MAPVGVDGSDGVSVIDGRLQFHDVDSYIAFIQTAAEWTPEQRAEWEARRGFVSYLSARDSSGGAETASLAASAPVEPDFYVGDKAAGSFLSPDGQVGIGDLRYDIEGDRLVGFDLNGDEVGDAAILMECPPTALDCPGNGGGGPGPGNGPSENPTARRHYGPNWSSNPNVPKRFRLRGNIFRTHIFIYSSIGAEALSSRASHNHLRGHYYRDHVPNEVNLSCSAYYDSSVTGNPPRFLSAGTDLGSSPTDKLMVFFDQDIFDFTSTGALERIACQQSAAANYVPGQAPNPTIDDREYSSGTLSTSRNF